jgi:RNA polymerase sigma factor (sigma-70 family)
MMLAVSHGSDVLLVFLGYAQDARAEAEALRGLQPQLQEHLDRLLEVCPNTGLSKLKIWKWEDDASSEIGGQPKLIDPSLLEAAVALFVFKGRIGPVGWGEIERYRSQRSDGLMIALFPRDPPPGMSQAAVADEWAALVKKRDSLTEHWQDPEQPSVRSTELYVTHDDLLRIGKRRLEDAIRKVVATRMPPAERPRSATPRATEVAVLDVPFVDALTTMTEHDPDVVREYRRRLRAEKSVDHPPSLSDAAFLDRLGFRRDGYLTRAGVLLFRSRPDLDLDLRTARLRCTRYSGVDQSAHLNRKDFEGPVQDLIERAHSFVKAEVRAHDIVLDDAPTRRTLYSYPMKCVRELVANALCHRDYSIKDAMTYVRIFTDRIEIVSPGRWHGRAHPFHNGRLVPLGVLMGQSHPPNFSLAHGIAAIDLVELEGSGIPTALRDCEEHRARDPSIAETDGYVVATVYPSAGWMRDESSLQAPSEPSRSSTLDLKLLAQWHAEDTHAGEQLINGHFFRVKLFFSRKLGDQVRVEDLVGRTFQRCQDARNAALGHYSTFSAFLFAQARTVMEAYLAQRDPPATLQGLCAAALDRVPFEAPERKPDRKLIVRAMRALPLDDQILVELVHLESLSLKDASEVLNTAESWVRRRLFEVHDELLAKVLQLAATAALTESTENLLETWRQQLPML